MNPHEASRQDLIAEVCRLRRELELEHDIRGQLQASLNAYRNMLVLMPYELSPVPGVADPLARPTTTSLAALLDELRFRRESMRRQYGVDRDPWDRVHHPERQQRGERR